MPHCINGKVRVSCSGFFGSDAGSMWAFVNAVFSTYVLHSPCDEKLKPWLLWSVLYRRYKKRSCMTSRVNTQFHAGTPFPCSPHLKVVCYCKVDLYFVHRQSVFAIRFGAVIFHKNQGTQSTSVTHSRERMGLVPHIPAPLTTEGGLFWETVLYLATIQSTPSQPPTIFHKCLCFLSNFDPISAECGWYYPNISLFFLKGKRLLVLIRYQSRPHKKHLRASFSETDASLF